MKIETGNAVIAVLQDPREKLFGILGEITSAGVCMRAIDLSYFEDWCVAIASGEPHLAMYDCFLPMWRVEKITVDTPIGELPSLSDQFEKRTGRSFSKQ